MIDTPRVEWDGVDLYYNSKKIEVKCSAYVQSWLQDKPSVIQYDIDKKKSWHADDNTLEKVPTRCADCYVFCLYPEMDKDNANVLDVGAWEFYVLSTKTINEQLGDRKSIGIKRLRQLCNPVKYSELKDHANKAIDIS